MLKLEFKASLNNDAVGIMNVERWSKDCHYVCLAAGTHNPFAHCKIFNNTVYVAQNTRTESKWVASLNK